MRMTALLLALIMAFAAVPALAETDAVSSASVADYYAAQGKHVAVDGVGSVDEIFARLCAEVDKLK